MSAKIPEEGGGGGGFHFLAHGLNLTITELLKALIYQVRHLHSE